MGFCSKIKNCSLTLFQSRLVFFSVLATCLAILMLQFSILVTSTAFNGHGKMKHSIIVHREVDDNYKILEFPYPKSCTFERPPPGHGTDYNIAIFYHVGLINNWKTIMWDQMHTLETCGLGYMANTMTISYNVDPNSSSTEEVKAELIELLRQFHFTKILKRIDYVEATSSPWEQEAIASISRTCHSSIMQNKRTFVYYFHNKGASRYTEDWKSECIKEQGYCNVLHWRKYLEFFLIEKPALCLTAFLEKDAATCGVNLHKEPNWHYNGNFWAASCDWVNTLPKIELSEDEWLNHITAELWIGKAISYEDDMNYTKHVSFFNSDHLQLPLGIGMGQTGTLYNNRLDPRQYNNMTNYTQDDNFYSKLWLTYLASLEHNKR